MRSDDQIQKELEEMRRYRREEQEVGRTRDTGLTSNWHELDVLGMLNPDDKRRIFSKKVDY